MNRGGLLVVALLVIAAIALGRYVSTSRVPAATPPWTRGAAMPTPRSEMPAAALDGIVYVPGGLGTFGRTLDAFEAYDVQADAWTSLPAMPAARHHAGVAATDGLVVVTGGFAGLDFSTGTSEAFAYSPDTGTWSTLPFMPGPRGAHTSVAYAGRVYVIGGVGVDPTRPWALDLSSGAWETSLAPMPTVREHLAAVVLDGLIYVIGGRWQGANLSAVEVYDPEADAWARAPDLPTPRSGLRAGALGGRIHAVGGEDLVGARAFATHEVYDPATGTWTVAVAMVAPRHGLAAAVVDDRMVVIGGATRHGAQTVLTLTRAVDLLAAGVLR